MTKGTGLSDTLGVKFIFPSEDCNTNIMLQVIAAGLLLFA